MKPDAIIKVCFLAAEKGGRKTAVEGDSYACPIFVKNEGFDCRLLLDGRRLELGKTYEVPIRFLYSELAIPKLAVGAEIYLWEGRKVAVGEVVAIIAD
ncbi:hypothetical protein XabCFBP2524_02515 [Xanthomonas axonopodis pv. begoniae]|nr:hypothetical protein XabCFBP2524_02515 [Xanthomonas axonopodis pv. begoniae]